MENSSSIEIPILIVIATVGILVFIFFIIFFVIFYQKRNLQIQVESEEKEKLHQQQLLKTSLEIAELERSKIASNLHDDIGPIINIVKHNISQFAHFNNPESIELKKQSDKLLESAMDNIRNITRELSPPVLMRFGFEEGLRELCTQLSNSKIIASEFQKEGETINISYNIQIQFYRLIQELINNIVKHAKARNLRVNLQYKSFEITVELNHNGTRINNSEIELLTKNSKGIGLKSIKNRADILKAKIDYNTQSSPAIKITLPLNEYEKTN